MRSPASFLLTLLLLAGACVHPSRLGQDDPYLWLENIEDEKSMEWVEKQDKASLAFFKSDPRYERFRRQAEDILQAPDRIPDGRLLDGYVYNFWQDTASVRGIWRRTPLEDYQQPDPAWENLLDLDALASLEKENWVYQGNRCLPPRYTRCLIFLSRGGGDASVMREFRVDQRAFVPDGFYLNEAKSSADWIDADTLAVGTDFGPGSLTRSGYPRVLKTWKRGSPLDDARTLFEGEETDVEVWPMIIFRPEGKTFIVGRSVTFFEHEVWLIGDNRNKIKLPLPPDAKLQGVFKGQVLAVLRSPWDAAGRNFAAGSLISLAATDSNASQVNLVYAPDERSAVRNIGTTRDAVLVHSLHNVAGEILQFGLSTEGAWESRRVPVPEGGTLRLISIDDFSNDVFVGYENFLVPDRLYRHAGGAEEARVIKSLPERFQAGHLTVEQKEAKSKDGTRVPYFIVRDKSVELNGDNPTLLYSYGGFDIALTPEYMPITGKLWLENGGVFVLANIRGGGEFGPRWHRAALKENRQKAFDDFIGVAEDLIRQNLTSPRRLGIMGGSNGGLLVGAVFVQRPGLFNAVVGQVPLLDMLRYSKLLAGASWTAEYGDPDLKAERPALARYSPYQQVRPGRGYPALFLYTSTKDDRVHPGHARKMIAKMQKLGYKAYYFENTEGGHSAAANLLQRAKRHAMEYVFLSRQLKDN